RARPHCSREEQAGRRLCRFPAGRAGIGRDGVRGRTRCHRGGQALYGHGVGARRAAGRARGHREGRSARRLTARRHDRQTFTVTCTTPLLTLIFDRPTPVAVPSFLRVCGWPAPLSSSLVTFFEPGNRSPVSPWLRLNSMSRLPSACSSATL